MKLSIIGCGYLGATQAACLAELGHEVIGVDVDPGRVADLSAGEVPFFEPGLSDVLRRNLEAGRVRFTTDITAAAEFADVHFLTVGTPQSARGDEADLGQVNAAVDALTAAITGEAVIIGRSTVPVGTTALLTERLARRGQTGIEIGWCPEFLREGFGVADSLTPDRIVIGAEPGGRSVAVVREVYRDVIASGTPVVECDTATAELVKASANAFLATKISFINAISELCEATGADVTTLADAIGHDVRIGRRFLNAGLGFGGGCLPKDIRALTARADELGVGEAFGFLREVDRINVRRRMALAELVAEACGGEVLGRDIAVLGGAFKPESDDIRDSPALNVAARLELDGARVRVFDPAAAEPAARRYPALGIADSIAEACDGADVVVVATEWAEFVHADPAALGELVRSRIVVDGRRCLPAAAWRAAGWEYHCLGGRPAPSAPVRPVSGAARSMETDPAVLA